MTAAPMQAFTYWMEAAREDLTSLARYTFKPIRAEILRRAMACLGYALGAANRLRDQPRRNLCLRVLTWLRAALATL